MHELSLAMSILDIVAEESARRGGVSVRAVHLKLGPLAGVAPEALTSAFDLARESSDVELVIREVPVRIRCPRCAEERGIVSLQEFCCAECGAASAEVTQGREMEIVALEIE
ncbi:MAG TPA: hydrogenase maturation nickel metallochaperone HypA [Gemmataceae bacterium]|nr:hydrogenase maturation nickel metallochaperone HypA [Gemmataceae bacterium]